MIFKKYLKSFLEVSPSINYFSFGFIPNSHESRWERFRKKLFGHQNLLKRLQAKDIINSLAIKPSDKVLDFGCGGGYITVELAKQAHLVIGIDILEYISGLEIPKSLLNKLKFITTSGEHLPFSESTFDVILASEVLPMLPDPNIFLEEIKRVLKPNGRLVIVNGLGHPYIEKLYQEDGKFIEKSRKKFGDRVPSTYEDFCSILQKKFGTSQERFFSELEIRNYLESNQFKLKKIVYSPSASFGSYFSTNLFLSVIKDEDLTINKNFFIKYLYFSSINYFQKAKYKGGLICVAENIK